MPFPDRSVIISDGLWQRRFAGDAGVLGQTIRVGDRPRPIVGVMPAGVWTAPLDAERRHVDAD